jgi:serine/threonine protein kinase
VLLAKSASGREVVLKIPLSSNADVLERVRDEARVGLRLQHPHIVETLDLFEHDGKPILVVEFVDGATLSQLRKVGALPASAIVRVGREIAEALTVIHEATDETNRPLGMLHRDVTSANILVSKTGEAKLIDLGIARSVETQARQTQVGAVRGTVRYLAPELLEGKKHSQATDLWALGVVLWESALGRVAVEGDDRTILAMILQGELMKYRPGEALDPRLHDALTALLAKEGARLQKAKAAANIMRRLEVAFGDGRAAAASAVTKCIALGYTERSGPAIGEATREALSDPNIPRPVTIPPPLSPARKEASTGITDPRAASSIDQPIDDERAPTVRMPAVAVPPRAAAAPEKPAVAPVIGPVGNRALQVDAAGGTQVDKMAPLSQSDFSSVSGRYRPTDIVPAYVPPSTTAQTEPTMPAFTLPMQIPAPGVSGAPPAPIASRAIPLTERNIAPLAGSAISSQIATEADRSPIDTGIAGVVVPLEPNEPTAAGLESQFGHEPTMVPNNALPNGGVSKAPPARPAPSFDAAVTLLQTPAVDIPSAAPSAFGGLTASGFRPPDGAVHSNFAEQTREAVAAYVPSQGPPPPAASTTSAQTPAMPLTPSTISSEPAPQATQMMHGGLAKQALGPSGTVPAMAAAWASDDDAKAAPGAAAAEPAPRPPEKAPPPPAPLKAPAVAAPPAELSEKLSKPLAAPPIASASLRAPPPDAAVLTPTGPVKQPPESVAHPNPMRAPVSPAKKSEPVDVGGPPPPAEDTFRPTVTQAFFTKDLQRVMQEAELGTSTVEMEAIRTPPKMWIAIVGGIAVVVILVVIAIFASGPDKDEAPVDDQASATAPPADGVPATGTDAATTTGAKPAPALDAKPASTSDATAAAKPAKPAGKSATKPTKKPKG